VTQANDDAIRDRLFDHIHKTGEEVKSDLLNIPEQGNGSTILFSRRASRSKSATVLLVRLVQEKPKFYDDYMRGKYRSVTAAATAAGLLKDDANLRRAKSACRKLTASERREFKAWWKKECP
jgi:hypothetical protein